MLNILSDLPVFKTVRGRQILSLWAAKFFEKTGIRKLFGAQLVAAVVLTGVVTPQINSISSSYQVEQAVKTIQIAADINTQSTFTMPVSDFRLSQTFSGWHQGIDLVAPHDTPVYAIESGQVEKTEDGFFGYGKNVLIAHDNEFKSLYAHLSQIQTQTGKKVGRGELIGLVGKTGWATGDHLHLEIHYKNIPINPLEVLPVKPAEIQYDGMYFQLQASTSGIATSSKAQVTSSPQ